MEFEGEQPIPALHPDVEPKHASELRLYQFDLMGQVIHRWQLDFSGGERAKKSNYRTMQFAGDPQNPPVIIPEAVFPFIAGKPRPEWNGQADFNKVFREALEDSKTGILLGDVQKTVDRADPITSSFMPDPGRILSGSLGVHRHENAMVMSKQTMQMLEVLTMGATADRPSWRLRKNPLILVQVDSNHVTGPALSKEKVFEVETEVPFRSKSLGNAKLTVKLQMVSFQQNPEQPGSPIYLPVLQASVDVHRVEGPADHIVAPSYEINSMWEQFRKWARVLVLTEYFGQENNLQRAFSRDPDPPSRTKEAQDIFLKTSEMEKQNIFFQVKTDNARAVPWLLSELGFSSNNNIPMPTRLSGNKRAREEEVDST